MFVKFKAIDISMAFILESSRVRAYNATGGSMCTLKRQIRRLPMSSNRTSTLLDSVYLTLKSEYNVVNFDIYFSLHVRVKSNEKFYIGKKCTRTNFLWMGARDCSSTALYIHVYIEISLLSGYVYWLEDPGSCVTSIVCATNPLSPIVLNSVLGGRESSWIRSRLIDLST